MVKSLVIALDRVLGCEYLAPQVCPRCGWSGWDARRCTECDYDSSRPDVVIQVWRRAVACSSSAVFLSVAAFGLLVCVGFLGPDSVAGRLLDLCAGCLAFGAVLAIQLAGLFAAAPVFDHVRPFRPWSVTWIGCWSGVAATVLLLILFFLSPTGAIWSQILGGVALAGVILGSYAVMVLKEFVTRFTTDGERRPSAPRRTVLACIVMFALNGVSNSGTSPVAIVGMMLLVLIVLLVGFSWPVFLRPLRPGMPLAHRPPMIRPGT